MSAVEIRSYQQDSNLPPAVNRSVMKVTEYGGGD